LRGSGEECKRLDKECLVFQGQISTSIEQLQAKNAEIKSLSSKIKDLQEEIHKQTAQLQEAHESSVNDLSNKLKEVKKFEENKNTATMKILTRKEK
jgi:predicted  nucleic acid-binding Zn-ribbon protein